MSAFQSSAADAKSGPPLSATPAIIGLVGFLTLVDLFAAQAILPTLAKRFNASPSAIGLAANASTLGMAAAGLALAFVGGRINRRAGATICLVLLALPTTALALVDNLSAFSALRVLQGLFMASAFSLTMAYLAERCTAAQSATTLAAYITGAVASNLIGRFVAATLTEAVGVQANFIFFAVLNLAGAALVAAAFARTTPMSGAASGARAPLAVMAGHLRNKCLRTSFAIGFLILFAFIGVFTYVNFVLARAPIALSPMALGFVYFVFLPSMITTPLAGRIATRYGARMSFLASLGLALLSLPMLLSTFLPAVIAGLAIFGVGTFFAQATATGFVGRAAQYDRAAASGMYLASYYLGGLAGAAILGRVFENAGWAATIAAVAAALALAAGLAAMLKGTTAEPQRR
jgi:predicted MFS family arabinose efflux permease